MTASAVEFTNRLANETSPYLLQHAHNPVDWWPWSPEAFTRAKLLDRPVFLSIGYAACHWCHVMEHERVDQQQGERVDERPEDPEHRTAIPGLQLPRDEALDQPAIARQLREVMEHRPGGRGR